MIRLAPPQKSVRHCRYLGVFQQERIVSMGAVQSPARWAFSATSEPEQGLNETPISTNPYPPLLRSQALHHCH